MPPFEAEMRRRLWWQITVLDTYHVEDRGSTPIIMPNTFSTKLPANINDEDLSPQSTNPIIPEDGCTEMTFCQLCYEASVTLQRFMALYPKSLESENAPKPEQGEEEKLVLERCRFLEKNFVVKCDTSIPIYWSASVVAKIIIIRLWLLLRYPLNTRHQKINSTTSRESILAGALTILELEDAIESSPSTAIWRWHTISYVAWYPIAVTLAELCVQTRGKLVERAWSVVERVYDKWANRVADTRKGALWRPIKKLLEKARKARLQELEKCAGSSVNFPPQSLGFQNMPPGFDLTSDPCYTKLHDSAVNFATGAPNPAWEFFLSIQMQDLSGNLISCRDTRLPDDLSQQVNWDDWENFIQSTWDMGPEMQGIEVPQPYLEGQNIEGPQWTKAISLGSMPTSLFPQ